MCVPEPLGVEIVATTIHDERGDTIDFATGEPIHTHAGAPITLGASGCPAVFKYGYLLDPARPFGKESTPNPIAWKFRRTGGTITTADVRVRTADGVKLDWAPANAGADGSYTVSINRSGPRSIAELAFKTEQLFIDFRARNGEQHEATVTGCWEQHPLVAPAKIVRLAAAPDSDALNSFSFAAHSPVSKLMCFFDEVKVLSGRISNQTAEPLTVQLDIPTPVVTFNNTVVVDWLQEGTQNVPAIDCGNTCLANHPLCSAVPATDPKCKTTTPFDPADPTLTGTLKQNTWLIHVLDAQTQQDAPGCTFDGPTVTCALPPRVVGSPAHEYIVVLSTNQQDELKPAAFGAAKETSFLGKPYTGFDVTVRDFRCDTPVSTPSSDGEGEIFHTCTRFTTFAKLQAIDQLVLDVAAPTMGVKTSLPAVGAAPGIDFVAPPYIAGGALGGSSFVWDSGNADLPGPH